MKHAGAMAAAVLATLVLCQLPGGVELHAREPDAAGDGDGRFLRLRRDGQGQPQALETAIVSYVPGDASRPGLVVDLIGAVHIGDGAYYERLNEVFRSYDVLLYELVAAEQSRGPRRVASGGLHPVSALQRGMKSLLDLEFQLEAIDYTPAHFVHADMTPEEFAQSMRDRGESLLQIYFRAMGQAMAAQSQDPAQAGDVRMLAALFARDRALRLKQIMAEQFEAMGGLTLGLDGPEGSAILTERNKRALVVLASRSSVGIAGSAFFMARHTCRTWSAGWKASSG